MKNSKRLKTAGTSKGPATGTIARVQKKEMWKLVYLVIFIGAGIAGDLLLHYILIRNSLQEQKESVTLKAYNMRIRVEEELGRNLYLQYGMASYISVRSQISKTEFNALAKVLFRQTNSLRNIGVAPDFVIKYIYPFKNNEKAIGLNYRKMPAQWPQALEAKQKGTMIVAGPIRLVQGGEGLVARVPVFTAEDNRFWGLVSSVIDFEAFVKNTGLDSEDGNIRFSLRGKDGKGSSGNIFMGDPALFAPGSDAIQTPIKLPKGTWILAALPRNGWSHKIRYSWIIHLVILLLTATGYLGTIQIKKDKIDLKERANQLRAMSRSTLDALIIIDADDTIIFWNPSAEKMFGYSEEEMIAKKMHQFVTTKEDMEKAYKGMKDFRKTGTGPILQQVREVNAKRRNGDLFPAELSVASFQLKGEWFAVGSIRDITIRKEYEHRLTLLATTDSLTGLFNRRRFMDLAGEELERAVRYRRNFSLMMLDLDHFKMINDTYGHDAGDKVLKTVAGLFRESLRKSDIAARIGGEEFAIALPETDSDSAYTFAERIRSKLMSVVIPGNEKIKVTVSIGLADLDDTIHSISEFLKMADKALYHSKENGRNRTTKADNS